MRHDAVFCRTMLNEMMMAMITKKQTGPRRAVWLQMRVWLQIQGSSSIPAWSHTFVEIDYGIISTVILLPSADSFKKGCFQLQAKVCARPEKSVVRWTDRPTMTIVVNLGRKATKQTKQRNSFVMVND